MSEDDQHDHGWRRFLARWVDGVAKRALWVAVALLLVSYAALHVTITKIKVNTNREKMLSADLPFRKAENRRHELFPKDVDNLALVIEGATPEDARAGALALAERLRARDDLFRNVYVPRADKFLEDRGLLYLDTDELEDLSQRLAEVQPFLGRLTGDESLRGLFDLLEQAIEADKDGTDVDLTRVVERVTEGIDAALAAEPYRLSWQALMQDEPLTRDDERQFILAQPVLDYGKLLPATSALDFVRTTADDLAKDADAGIRVRITGGLAMATQELQTVSRGAEWFGLGVFLAIGVILYAGLRSGRLVAASLITLVAGLACTAGFATIAIGHLNLVSVAFGILYIGLGIDYAIHLTLRYREGIRNGRDHGDALRRAAQDVGGSLVLCTLSTALGFYAFVPTAYSGVSELGLISGTGMFISLFLNLTLLPALLTLMPLRSVKARETREHGPLYESVTTFPVRRHRPILVASVILGLAGSMIIPRIRFDWNPLNLRDRSTESVATFDELLRTSETPPWNLDILAADAGTARATAERVKALPEVDKAIHVESFVPDDQDEKLIVIEDTALILGLDVLSPGATDAPNVADNVAAARSLREALAAYGQRTTGGTDREAAAKLASTLQRLEARTEPALFDKLSVSLLATLPANMQRLRTSLETEGFARSDLPAHLVDRWVATDGTHRVQVYAKKDLSDPDALEAFVDATRAVAPNASGSPVVMLESGRAVAGAFRQALLVAVIATGLVLLLMLRNLVDVLFVIVPLLLAAVLTAASMILLKVPFNFANVIALPLLLGIGVDDGIHMVDRARHGLGGGDVNPLQTSTARGVIFTTLTTSVSFGQLALSPHPGTASLGLLLSSGMGFLLLSTLVVIPALLAWSAKRSQETSAA